MSQILLGSYKTRTWLCRCRQYDTIRELNVEWKRRCDQLSVAHVNINKKCIQDQTKTNKRQCLVINQSVNQSSLQLNKNLNQVQVQDLREGTRKGLVRQKSYKSGGKGLRSDTWRERRCGLLWDNEHRMRWTSRTVNITRLMEESWFCRWGDNEIIERRKRWKATTSPLRLNFR